MNVPAAIAAFCARQDETPEERAKRTQPGEWVEKTVTWGDESAPVRELDWSPHKAVAAANRIGEFRPVPGPKVFRMPLTPERRNGFVRAARAEREFLAHCRAETGAGISAEELARQTADKTEVRLMSHKLAQRLESAGRNAYRNEAFSLWVYFVHSGKTEQIPNFRRICLLPYVAAIVRANKLAALEYFIQRHPQCRFWTFTTGDRVTLDGLRARCQWLARRLSKLNAFLTARFGVELIFRSTEFGTLEFDDAGNRRESGGGNLEFDKQGEPLFHVHAHCVVHSLVGFIAPEKWKAMFEAVWEFWGFNWDGGKRGCSGIIRDARECCKYVTKPGDMLKLSAEQLARMHEAVFRLKLVHPMGSLAKEMRERDADENQLTLRRFRNGQTGKMEWREVGNHNAWLKQDAEEREAAENLRSAQEFAEEMKAAVNAEKGGRVRITDLDTSFCRVFSRLGPAAGPDGRKEPRVIVGGTYFDRRFVDGHPLVSRLWSQTVQGWEAASGISVHTGTPTVLDEPGYSQSEDGPPLPGERFLNS